MSQEHSPTQQDSDKAVLFCKTFQHEKSSPEQAGKFLGCQDTGQSGRGPGEEQKTQRGHFPLGTEGPGFSGIISFSRAVDTYWVGVSQVLGPDPEPWGGNVFVRLPAALPFNKQLQPTVRLATHTLLPPALSCTPPSPAAPLCSLCEAGVVTSPTTPLFLVLLCCFLFAVVSSVGLFLLLSVSPFLHVSPDVIEGLPAHPFLYVSIRLLVFVFLFVWLSSSQLMPSVSLLLFSVSSL